MVAKGRMRTFSSVVVSRSLSAELRNQSVRRMATAARASASSIPGGGSNKTRGNSVIAQVLGSSFNPARVVNHISNQVETNDVTAAVVAAPFKCIVGTSSKFSTKLNATVLNQTSDGTQTRSWHSK